MKITKNRLKQIIKEEIEALGEAGFTSLSTGRTLDVTDEDIEAAENLFAQIKDNDVNVRMKNIIADVMAKIELLQPDKYSRPSDEDFEKQMKLTRRLEKFKKQYFDFLQNNIFPAFPEYKNFSDGAKYYLNSSIESDLSDAADDIYYGVKSMNESIGGLMKDLGYEKARKAVASAIDFDEKVDNMEDLEALIDKLGSEKDPMGRGRKEELDDIEAALRNISEAMSDDEDYSREEDKQGVRNELVIMMDVPENIITDDLLNAIMNDKRYRKEEPVGADITGSYSIPGFLTRDDVIELAKKLRLDKKKEASYLSEKLKRIIKEEIENLSK
jgi:hypothetical protein